jgi:hypothetical protein
MITKDDGKKLLILCRHQQDALKATSVQVGSGGPPRFQVNSMKLGNRIELKTNVDGTSGKVYVFPSNLFAPDRYGAG